MIENKMVVPFDSFSPINKVILWAGYSTLDKRAKTWKKILHEIYRRLALTIIIVYYLQLIMYALTSRVSVLFDILIILMAHSFKLLLCYKASA